jgi:predicted transposase YdaD
LYRIYGKPIEQIVIFLRPDNSPQVFEDSFQVGNTIHCYRVIRIWECDPTPLLQKPELLPLAVLAQTKQPKKLLSQVAQSIDRIEDKRKQSNIAACVELLAGINYSEDLIAMYLQEDILQESVIYKKIINEGIEQGIKRGEKSEAIALVNRLIKKRFGEINDRLQARIKSLSLEQLESLGESLFDFDSLDDVSVWLSQVHD